MAIQDDAVRAAIVEARGPDTLGLELLALPDQDAALRPDVKRIRTSQLLAVCRSAGSSTTSAGARSATSTDGFLRQDELEARSALPSFVQELGAVGARVGTRDR